MKALVKTATGVVLDDRPQPQPGPGEVLLQVECAGLCRTDVYVATGALPIQGERILGHEFCGRVERLGPGVDRVVTGQRVAVFPWIGCGQCEQCSSEPLQVFCPQRQFLGLDRDGAFAEYLTVPADRCFPVGDLDLRAAAYAEPVAAALGVTKTVMMNAPRAGVLGRNRIASLTERLLAHFRQQPLLESEQENSYDALVESGGRVEEAMRLLRPGGTLVLKSRPPGLWEWPTRLQVEKEITVQGVGYGSFTEALELLRTQPQLFQDLWEEPRPLQSWEAAFEESMAGREERKAFFRP